MNDFPSDKNQQQDASPGLAASICMSVAGALIFFFPKVTEMSDRLAVLTWILYVSGLVLAIVGIVCLGTAIDKERQARRFWFREKKK